MKWNYCLLVAVGLLASPPVVAADKCQILTYAELPVTMVQSRPLLSGTINDQPVVFMLQSSATYSSLATTSAQRLGLKLRPTPFRVTFRDDLGNTVVPKQAVARSFSLAGYAGGRPISNVPFLVMDTALPARADADGTIGRNLIGLNDSEFDLANAVVRLHESKHCSGQVLAYWRGSAPLATMEISEITPESPFVIGDATLNGKPIRVMFDTGAGRSYLTSRAAARAGVTLEDDGIGMSGPLSGLGKRQRDAWLGRFDTLDLGGEVIQNARLAISDIEMGGGADLVLGTDFFLAHRVYLAPKQRVIWFTYNGGPVFDLRLNSDKSILDAARPAPSAMAKEGDTLAIHAPANAADYVRRGAASASRRDYAAAIADFDQAVALAPADPDIYYQRGMTQWHIGQLELALRDFDHALDFRADDAAALIARGEVRLQTGDVDGAHQDLDRARILARGDVALEFRTAGELIGLEQYADAILWIDAVIAAEPPGTTLGEAFNIRCWARAMLNQELDKALADCNSALDQYPDDSGALDSRALVHLRRGELDEAIRDYKKSLKLQPLRHWTRYGLGLAELKKGLQADGERNIQMAVAGEPGVAERYKRIGLSPPIS